MPGFLGFLLVLAVSLVSPQDPRQIPSARDSPNPTWGPRCPAWALAPRAAVEGVGCLPPHVMLHLPPSPHIRSLTPGEGGLAAVGRRAGLGEAGCLMKY